jgi:tryptophan 2,3-dioxygenase
MTATPAGMTYAEYLHLDSLLSAQHPISDLHDEMLFVIIHQAKELWLKQMLHEVRFACELVSEDKFAEAYKALSRVSRIWTVMTLSWDVLATLTPVDYSAFRDVLGTSSGFQSAQFRELEYRLGIKDPRFLDFYEGGTEGHAREGAGGTLAVGRGQYGARPGRIFDRGRTCAEGRLARNLPPARRIFRPVPAGGKAGRPR